MKYQVIKRNAFQVVGVRKEFSCGAQEAGIPGIPAFWDEALANGSVDKLAGLVNGEIKGLLGITDNFNEQKNTIDYWIAVEHNGEVPNEWSSFEYPKSKWVVFEVVGEIPSAMIDAWRRIYTEWFPSNGYQSASLAPMEVYLDENLYQPNS